jgi:hypothetical protein
MTISYGWGGVMTGKRFGITVLAIVMFTGVFEGMSFHAFADSSDIPRMTKEELKPLLGNPDVAVIDVRLGGDWAESDLKIKGAVRENPRDIDSWADKYSKNQTLVFYCA